MQAVAALTSLRSLQLKDTATYIRKTADDWLDSLVQGLQQLTQLQIGPVRLVQLQVLPPRLQQLHVTVNLQNDMQQLLQLASWLQKRSSIVSSLGLVSSGPSYPTVWDASWTAAVDTLAAALRAAALPEGSQLLLFNKLSHESRDQQTAAAAAQQQPYSLGVLAGLAKFCRH
jgi:hypothetical protein